MEDIKSDNPSSGYAMSAGDGEWSYTKNSSTQKHSADVAKSFVHEAIVKQLNVENFHGSIFRIADLGCSTGPNTFFAVENIIEAVGQNYQNQHKNKSIPEFQVFFNDHVSNDFNTLFRSLPTNRKYYASGVPGSFYTRLFPSESIHFFNAFYAIHWMSKLPDEIMDRNSPAWNKGRIHYANASQDVIEAYAKQHARDVDLFLNARAREIVEGGLMAIIVISRPNNVPHYEVELNFFFEVLGSCLVDLAKKGKIAEKDIDFVNIPLYTVSPQELEETIHENDLFTLERMEPLPVSFPRLDAKGTKMLIRPLTESLISEKFGDHILDELFELYEDKMKATPDYPITGIHLFVLLKRKINT